MIVNNTDAYTNIIEEPNQELEPLPITPEPEKSDRQKSSTEAVPNRQNTVFLSIAPPETM